jgi:hypothetical protein
VFNLSVYAPNEQLFVAILTFDEGEFEAALKRGADPNWRHPGGMSMLDAAVSVMPKPNSTALSRNERAINSRMVQRLLSLGADVRSMAPENTHSVLHVAAMKNVDPKCLKAILDAGANVNARDKDGMRPIDAAKTHGSDEMALALIKAGAETSGLDPQWLQNIRRESARGR